ncbi:signal recognition particle-docking protein FtsY [Hyphomicrobium sp. LHD-15]|uniref:signal recognition particle-docking protein FtsY n=1 Tax=Hyphomicrobium sp. LHD-15 TaxID=3072142 RepID=UPI00280C8EC6|nr:signal recognition particle-docking protein FtsY [Hyphomicrobium sp. LHD-15]MDQ8698614.1 signal recognition particle-docking protein FtsY [Hyphomicrobium sp. LHD-15]
MTGTEPKKKGFLSRWLGTSEPAPLEDPTSTAPASEEIAPVTPAEPVEPIPAEATASPATPEETVESQPTAEPEPPAPDAAAPAPAEPARKGWFERLKSGLSKTSTRLTESITGLVTKRKLDQDTLDELEEVLLAADLGIETSERITAAIAKGRFEKTIAANEVREILAEEVARVLEPVAKPLVIDETRKPHVVLVLGVNGSGKTTTIGKLSAKLSREGRRVMLAAGDTFRAAAIDQLKVWGERTGVPVLARDVGSDASGLAFDAIKQAQEGGYDVLLVDTAGRLQNKEGLMAELEKVVRVMRKVDATAPHDVLLVLDATTGQNAMQQVEVFRERAGVTGLVMTKLDGTARGGILVAIAARHGLPVHAIGVGESVDDLQSFSAKDYARAIAEI